MLKLGKNDMPYLSVFIYFERERESRSGGKGRERGRERGRENPKQAPPLSV